jgi:hypothetical protein
MTQVYWVRRVCVFEFVNGQWAMGNGQWAMGNGQWAMGNGQWAMGNGQWANKSRFENFKFQFGVISFKKTNN